ncbi:unnamed protein product [Allacma fusca]|uniref:Glucuronosyltransferase n=1 Tax=Allacma fusca TaxID=39272 RepID=A0A8J2NUP3_9HEXA|nr:unnamed protein product [Allacma fusca]
MQCWLPNESLTGAFKTIMDNAVQILAHPNLKAFISHAGLNSLSEATYHGVPVILMPLFADQDYNGYRIQATEIGIRLEMRDINTNLMVESVSQVLNNPKYAKNMKAMSAIFRDRPMSPIETAVYWTEFVLRHEDLSSLKPLNNVNFFQRRLLDIMLLLFIFIVAVFFVLVRTCMWVLQKLSRSRMSEKARKSRKQMIITVDKSDSDQHPKKE